MNVISRVLMNSMQLLIVTAFIEVGTGLFLLFLPSIPFALLLGVNQAVPEAGFIARLAGAALFAIGITCFLARGNQDSSAQRGVLTGILIYNVAAAALLAYAGTALSMAGIALWPAVGLHTILAVWCAASFSRAHRMDQRYYRY